MAAVGSNVKSCVEARKFFESSSVSRISRISVLPGGVLVRYSKE